MQLLDNIWSVELLLQLAGLGPGSAEGRKLINEQMIYGDREKIENRDAG